MGINFAKDTKKFQIGGNVQYGHSDNDARRKTSSETFLGETSSFAQVKTIQIVIVMILGLIFVWNGVLIH